MPRKFIHNQERHEIISVNNVPIGYLDVNLSRYGSITFELTVYDEYYTDFVNEILDNSNISYDVDDLIYTFRNDDDKLTSDELINLFNNLNVTF